MKIIKLQLKDDPVFAEKFIRTIDGVMSIQRIGGNSYIIELDEDKRDQDSLLDVLRDASISYMLEVPSSQADVLDSK